MFLTDATIKRLLSVNSREGFQESETHGNWVDADNTLLIFPFDEEHLTPLGYDMAIGKHYLSMTKKDQVALAPNEPLTIQPNETILVSTEEYIGLPKNRSLVGLIESKVSVVSKGLSHVSTTLDPDWEGHLLVAVTNLQTSPITLRRGEPFCTAMFARTTDRAEKSGNKPPNRDDIIREKLEKWLRDAKEDSKQAELTLFRQLLLSLIQILIILIASAIGLLLYGPTEGFAGSIAVGVAIATIVFPALQIIVQRFRQK